MPLLHPFRLARSLSLSLAATIAIAACGPDDDGGGEGDAGEPGAPVFRNPVDMPDDQLAVAALERMGAPIEGATKSCDSCHGLTQESLRRWQTLGDHARSGCIADLEVADPAAARAMIDCLRLDPADPESAFSAVKLGIYSTAADLGWFRYLFDLAYGEEGPSEHDEFVERVGMPRGDQAPFDQAAFDLIAEYFTRGLPLIEEFLPDESLPGCTVEVSADVAAHVMQMQLEGWRAVNADNAILMHGCGKASTPLECLTDRPRVTEWESLDGTVVRSLRTIPYSSRFWTRSSADGRFVAHGAMGDGFTAAFVDLQADTVIPADSLYDPAFFPDNSGFAFQDGEAHFCEQAVLTAGPAEVTFTEPGCTTNSAVGLYEHLGAALGGGDYWAVHSQFVSDDGGQFPTLQDPVASFSVNAKTVLTPMTNTGSQFMPGDPVAVDTPGEGDAVLSPSARILVTRVNGPQARQLGLQLRRIDSIATPGSEVQVPAIGRYCVNGGKPSFSFDERWLTYHHYVEAADATELGFEGPDDPAFAPYLEQGAANVWVLDLLSGVPRRVTRMAPGEYALYPHFRSDGWIYFMVRNLAAEGETIAATDAALVLEQ